jgi:hypothetical protein
MNRRNSVRIAATYLALGAPILLTQLVSADSGGVSQAQSFIKTLTGDLSLLGGGIAGLFLVYGGVMYSTASNNPERMDGSKKTMTHALIGLVIVVAAYSIITFATDAASKSFGS